MDPSYRQRFSICQQLRRDGLLTGENNDPWSLWEEYPWESISTPSERNLEALMFWIYYTTENPQHTEGLLDLLGKFRTENFTDLSPKFSTFLVLLEALHPIEPENLPTFSRLLWALNGFSQLNPEFKKKIESLTMQVDMAIAWFIGKSLPVNNSEFVTRENLIIPAVNFLPIRYLTILDNSRRFFLDQNLVLVKCSLLLYQGNPVGKSILISADYNVDSALFNGLWGGFYLANLLLPAIEILMKLPLARPISVGWVVRIVETFSHLENFPDPYERLVLPLLALEYDGDYDLVMEKIIGSTIRQRTPLTDQPEIIQKYYREPYYFTELSRRTFANTRELIEKLLSRHRSRLPL